MGHRSSKSSAASATGNTTKKSVKANRLSSASAQLAAHHRQSNLTPIPPVINLQFEESPNASSDPCSSSNISSSHTSTNSSYPRQIIIKIQLTKMENGQHESHDQQAAQAPEVLTANFRDYYATDANSNQLESPNAPIFDLMLNQNYSATTSTTTTTTAEVNRAAARSSTAAAAVAATSSLRANYNRHTLRGRMNAMQLNERPTEQNNVEAAEYCEVLEEGAAASILSSAFRKAPRSGSASTLRRSAGTERKEGDSARRAKNRSSFSSFKRMLEPSGSKSNKHKERQEHNNNNQQHSKSSRTYPVLSLTTPERQQQQQPCCSAATRGTAVASTSASASISTSTPISLTPPSAVGAASAAPNRLSIRTQNNADVIIPFSSPQFVVVCPTTSLVTVGRFDNNGISLMTTEIGGSGAESTNITTVHSSMTAKSAPSGPIVHSQVDFVHCLVPDLMRIFNSSFYWGKMDRYEAERLLEGKPEGTFLLRDSAQEEYLFSVTFRKYERSLHARIEQSGHKFSFDCHDPCVFTAPTVTGLLEHYKDPSCVMFFEPMLTIPFHRKAPFSLQQLARAAIVSHTTYDGISELELPMRLKAYLKEYHYKQKLRVKPFDESCFTCT